MGRRIILYLLGVVALGLIGIVMMPEKRDEDDGIQRLPWRVSVDSRGHARVFGFTLGETTLAGVRAAFGEDGKINLFSRAHGDDEFSVEAYFEQLYLEGLRADLVITLEADQQMLTAMYERGLRISRLGSGDKKVELAPADIDSLLKQPIRAITYLPWKSLDAEILRKRFGEPKDILSEESGVSHWLYPDKGMDIGLDEGGGVVIQYVNPEEFESLIAPLKESSRQGEPKSGGPAVEAMADPAPS
jgi:hypothetical protein